MVASVQSLAQAAVARIAAAAEAMVFTPGQVLDALVLGKTPDGLTALRIGEVVINAQLPQTLPPGTSLQLQVKSGGPTPQLAIVAPPVPPLVSQPLPLPPVVPLPPAAQQPAAAQPPPAQPVAPLPIQVNGEIPVQVALPATAPAASATPPESVARSAAPSPTGQLAPTQPLPASSGVPPVPSNALQFVPQPAAAQSPPSAGQAPAPPPPPPPPSGIAESQQAVTPLGARVAASAPTPIASAPPAANGAPIAVVSPPNPIAPAGSPVAPPGPVPTAAVPPPAAPTIAAAASQPPAPAPTAVQAASVQPGPLAAAAGAPPPAMSQPAAPALANLTVSAQPLVSPPIAAAQPAVSPPIAIAQPAAPVAPPPPVQTRVVPPAAVIVPALEPEANPLLLAQGAPRPVATMADLPKSLPQAPPQASTQSAPPQPATPQAALAQMVPEAMAKQNSLAPLLASLASVVAKPSALPEPILRAALQILAQRIAMPASGPTADILKAAIAKSGVYLEASLAKSTPPAGDMKAGLVALKSVLTTFLGGNPAPVSAPHQAAPPLKGMPPRAEAIEPLPLPDAPREAARALHSQADAALSRVKLMQLASLPDADPLRGPGPELRTELPFLIGSELVMAQFQIFRDGGRHKSEGKRGWTMRFAMNFSGTGEVGAEIGLLGRSVNVALWAAEPDIAERLAATLPELNGALAALGLDAGAIRVRNVPPQPPKPASGHFLDSVS